MNTPPVILLAFANEKMEGRFLHTLKDEIAALRKALQPAEDAGLCEIVLLPNATTEEILDTFQRQRYRDRIALFHYGGHADGYQLLLESSQGHNEVAHGEGLVSFLGRQDSLQLVFLNGCATQQQSEELIQAGVPTVIGTYTAISDNLATMLASRFYSSLGQGQHLARAWEEAEDEVRLRYGSGTKRGLVFDDEEEAESYDGFPWNLLVRPGSEKVREWSLPAAVNNHLFGLPEVPIRDLPEIPFRFLQRYTFEEAALFFGRGRYIRTLYTRLLDTQAAPITLFYGQSGVGKSSLLDAGLLPRLEKEAHVIYLRRDHTLGLTGTLAQAFEEIPQKQGAEPLSEADLHKLEDNLTQLRNTESQLTGASKVQVGLLIEELEEKIKASKPQHRDQKVDTSDFLAAWHHFEAQVGKPYIIILDQVEEVFYRANHNQPAELEDFLHVLGHIFGIPQARPSGKIILAYRKEYHPEILEFCKDAGLPREEVFLKQLGRDDIAEVILGIGSTPRLRSTYRVQVEPELPYIIADDLLVDRDSPIAPVLQIVLTKLWQLTENDEVRNFTVAKYQELQREGILLDSFYYQQMDKLQAQHPQLESSGLALDMLAYHTTVMGTSNAKADVEIKARYDQRPEASLLLKSFKSLYLLSDTGGIMTSLAHDTLAPLVRKEFQQSGRPGQRASIILENKLLAYSKDPETVLDPADLATVEAGKLGMAAWKGDSLKLIEASRKHRDKLQQVRQRNLMGFGAMGLVLLVVAFFFYRSVQESQETEQYLTELNDSRVLTAKAAGLSSIDRSQAIRVAEMACEKGGVIVYEAEAKLQEIYNQGAAFPFYRRVIDLAENELPDPIFLEKMTLSPLKNHLLLFYVDSTDTRTGIVYDLIQETVAKRITGFRAACWTDNEQNLIVQEGENKLALWDWENAQVGKFVTFKKPIEAFYYHPERERVLLSLENGDLQSLDVGDFENQEVKTGFFQAPEKPVFYDLSQDFYINDEGIVRRISNKQNKRIPPETWTRIQSYLASGREATFSIDAPEGVEAEGVFVIDAFGGMRFLDIFEANAQAQTIAAHGQPIRQFIVDAPYIYTFASPKGNQKETPDYALKKWKLGVFEQPVSTFLGSTAPFIGMYKDPDTKTVYTLDQKGKLRIWPESSHSGSTEMLRRDLHIHEITTLPENKRWHFSPSGDVAFVELSSRRWGLHLVELDTTLLAAESILQEGYHVSFASDSLLYLWHPEERVLEAVWDSSGLSVREVVGAGMEDLLFDGTSDPSKLWGLKSSGDKRWLMTDLLGSGLTYDLTSDSMTFIRGKISNFGETSDAIRLDMIGENEGGKQFWSEWQVENNRFVRVNLFEEDVQTLVNISASQPDFFYQSIGEEFKVIGNKAEHAISIYDHYFEEWHSVVLNTWGPIQQLAFETPNSIGYQDGGTMAIITANGEVVVINGKNYKPIFSTGPSALVTQRNQLLPKFTQVACTDEELRISTNGRDIYNIRLPVSIEAWLNEDPLPVIALPEARKDELLYGN